MELVRVVVGQFETNAYIIYANNSAVVVDPGGDAERISDIIKGKKLNVELYILTHAHYDHFAGLEALRALYMAPVAIHLFDAPNLLNPSANLSLLLGNPVSVKGDIILHNEQILEIIGHKFLILHTPGHTPGSISILYGKNILTGDTIFKGGIGRTDLPGGNYDDLIRSIKRILELPPDIIIYPGHGEPTTIAKERISNII